MKIIKEGQLPQERLYVCTCDNCKTEFSFHQKEGKVVHDQRVIPTARYSPPPVYKVAMWSDGVTACQKTSAPRYGRVQPRRTR